MVVQSKRWMLFGEVPLSNASGPFAFGYRDVNISVGNAGWSAVNYAPLMNSMAANYEEYRVRRVHLFAQPATGYTNDDRIKSSVFARVDVNSQPTAATVANLQTLINAECAVNRTFTEKSNVKLVDYAPICYSSGSTGASSRPLLPTSMQWYNIDERAAHVWRGATIAPLLLDATATNKRITVWASVEMEFRSRRYDFNTTTVAFPALGAADKDLLDESATTSDEDLEDV